MNHGSRSPAPPARRRRHARSQCWQGSFTHACVHRATDPRPRSEETRYPGREDNKTAATVCVCRRIALRADMTTGQELWVPFSASGARTSCLICRCCNSRSMSTTARGNGLRKPLRPSACWPLSGAAGRSATAFAVAAYITGAYRFAASTPRPLKPALPRHRRQDKALTPVVPGLVPGIHAVPQRPTSKVLAAAPRADDCCAIALGWRGRARP